MAKSLKQQTHKVTKMEFKKEDVKIVNEKEGSLFSNTEFKIEYPCDKKDSPKELCNKRWIDSLSDCA